MSLKWAEIFSDAGEFVTETLSGNLSFDMSSILTTEAVAVGDKIEEIAAKLISLRDEYQATMRHVFYGYELIADDKATAESLTRGYLEAKGVSQPEIDRRVVRSGLKFW